jgi:hypothetical protein
MMRTRAEKYRRIGQECLASTQETHTALPETEFSFRLAKEQEPEFWFRVAREQEYKEAILERRPTYMRQFDWMAPGN